jgi:hypothetical protein
MLHTEPDLGAFKRADNDFAHLSLPDLVAARDLYHVHLMNHPNVVATAIGRYRIRTEDSWPNDSSEHHGSGVRRLDNSEVRPYSWPCILVFVAQWEPRRHFANDPSQAVPKTLFMPDGRRVPVCIVEAPRQHVTDIAAQGIAYPLNNLGSGNPIVAQTQGNEYVATIACLVSDGHRVYALTNRHVTGVAGEVVWARIGGRFERVGVTSAKQLTRLELTAVYPELQGKDTYLNLDVGLIDLDDLARWTTDVRGIGQMGPMADFSGRNLSLSLIGCQVRGVGAASGDMRGEIHGLFYRYKTGGGFEYVADLFIGPRTTRAARAEACEPQPFSTLPGDSGTLWLLEPAPGHAPDAAQYLPLAMEWGRNMLYSSERARPQAFALATLLSRVCALLEVDPIRNWNVDQDDVWGSIGHFSIAARAQVALSGDFPGLDALMRNNAAIISQGDAAIEAGDFSGMGSQAFVPMADVPDFFWKPRVGKQGHARALEGPNHFADMDQKDAHGKTLLSLSRADAFIDPDRWHGFYDSVRDLLSGKPISVLHRGLLPFRVWQIFDAMVDFAASGQADRFVCAGGVLTHYIGDVCQPLHISYLHDGDPLRPFEYVFSSGKKAGESEQRPLGQGVHSAYEDAMVHANRSAILAALGLTPKVKAAQRVGNGFEAARATIALMRSTIRKIPPAKIVQAYVDVGKGGKAASDALWKAFGKKTLAVMQDGAHLIALLWESAWSAGGGEGTITTSAALPKEQAMAIVADPAFLPSVTIDRIGVLLKR